MSYPRRVRFGLIALLALTGAAAGVSSPAAAQIVYSQPSDFPAGTLFASQNDPGGFGEFATSYDNFTLAGATLVNGVAWQGGYFNPPSAGSITAFTLTFWSDSGGAPGAALLTQTLPGNAGETFVGLQSGVPIYDYSAALPTAFVASASSAYWLSIVPDLADPPEWGWHTGTGGDGQAVFDFLGSRSPLDSDLAFTLSGTAVVVPEPSTLLLIAGAGISGIGWISRRRRRR